MKLSDLPKEEMPRERLIRYGAENLSNEELISILLRTGTKNENVKELASKVLSKIKLNDFSLGELTSINGLGKAKALSIIAAIEFGKRVNNMIIPERLLINSTEVVHSYFASMIANNKQEKLLVILLDNKKRLISYNVMYKGTFDKSNVSVKEIFNYAVKERAAAFIIMHNHPSGVIKPSNADKLLTNDLLTSGRIIGIPLLDHIITNGKEYYSFLNEMITNEV